MKISVCLLYGCLLLGGASCFNFSPIIAPKSSFIKNRACRLQSDAYYKSIKNFTLWAVQMYDSSAKMPSGILQASSHHFGRFDECLQVQADLGQEFGGKVNGKYCLVKLQLGIDVPHSPPRRSFFYDPHESAWQKIRPSGEVSLWRRNLLQWGICVPAVCTKDDIQAELDHVLRENFGDDITGEVDPALCQTKATVTESATVSPFLDNLTLGLFALLFLLVGASTAYDFLSVTEPDRPVKTSFSRKLLQCFSLQENVPVLVCPKKFHSGFDLMTGCRAILTILVLYGHRWRLQIIAPLTDATQYEEKGREFTILTNCLIVLNSFFVISGFITGYFFYAELEKRENDKKLSPQVILVPIIYRFLRFTPIYAVVILLNLTVLPKLGNGPLWPATVQQDIENCKENWWANLLLINNYYSSEKMCMFQSWYLATDMQLFILALVLLYIYRKNKSLGKKIILALITLSIISQAILIYTRKDPAYLQVNNERMKKIPNEYYYRTYYITTHFRIPSYMIGVIFGVKSWEWRDVPTQLSMARVNTYSFLLSMSLLVLQAIGHVFSMPTAFRDDPFYCMIYGALHCPLWAILTSLIITLSVRKPGGLMEKILSIYPLFLLSKLSYTTYFLHIIPQAVELGGLRAPKTPSRQEEYWLTAGDVIYVNLCSFFLSLLVEVPFSRLQKLIIYGDRPQEDSGEKSEPKKVD